MPRSRSRFSVGQGRWDLTGETGGWLRLTDGATEPLLAGKASEADRVQISLGQPAESARYPREETSLANIFVVRACQQEIREAIWSSATSPMR